MGFADWKDKTAGFKKIDVRKVTGNFFPARDRFRDAFENGGFVGAGRAGGSGWTGGSCCAATGSGESGRGRDALRRSPRDWERRLQG